MNILKIKLLTITVLTIGIFNTTLAQETLTPAQKSQVLEVIDEVNPTEWGVTINSDKPTTCQFSLKNQANNVHFGSLTGQQIDGDNILSLRNSSYENILTIKGKRVGINQTNPQGDLHINKNGILSSSFNHNNNNTFTTLSHNYYWNGGAKRLTTGKSARIGMSHRGDLFIQTAGQGNENSAISFKTSFLIDNDGRVSIGDNAFDIAKKEDGSYLSTDEYRLYVEKGIITEKVKCAIDKSTDWADYVFEEDYEMMDIDDLEGFVTENKHLPNVPSAEEMVENGLDVAKMDAKLLEKIEEAYLYIIDMNKEMKTMNEKVDALANENDELKASISAISTSGK